MKQKIRFIMIGSGWRAMYYIRIAKALPEQFECAAMFCRTKEKADLIRRNYHINTVTTVQECLDEKPDFAIVAVTKIFMTEVAAEWCSYGIPVLMETPAGLNKDQIQTLYALRKRGNLITCAEQYRLYPQNIGIKMLIDKGMIGESQFLYLSQAHEYHGASLMRWFLGIPYGMPFEVHAQEWSFPVTETLSRYERFTDGHLKQSSRAVAVFQFENGKACVYDFDLEQYRSPIRSNLLKLQGNRGEIIDNTVRWLDKSNHLLSESMRISTRMVTRDYDNPNLHEIKEITEIRWNGELLYQPPFGLCGLTDDETAIACVMDQMKAWVNGYGNEPYPFKEALIDAWTAVLLRTSLEQKKSEVFEGILRE